jgi:ribose 5-phosphate isomerase B
MRDVLVGADHRGFNLKNKVVEYLRNKDWNVTDLSNKYDPDDDYPDIAVSLGEKVVTDQALGVLICSSGAGVCAVANKVKGVRAAMAINPRQARKMKEDDDINVICLSADFASEEENLEIVEVFLQAVFAAEERFIRRIKKISKYETT